MNPPAANIHGQADEGMDSIAHIDLIGLHRRYPQRYPFLLESVLGDVANTARYSLLLAYPGDRLELTEAGLFENGLPLGQLDFLDQLNVRYQENPSTNLTQPFNGGWFLYLGYELAGQIEPSLHLPESESGMPIALAVRCAAAIVIDHKTGSLDIIVEDDHKDALAIRHQIQADLAEANGEGDSSQSAALPLPVQISEDPAEQFLAHVERIQEYICAGDVFQVNLSRGWEIIYAESLPVTEIYTRLRQSNPAPFAGLFRWQDNAVVSSSPERLIEVDGRTLQTRPIAGTRPRLSSGDLDAAERESLLLHPKERAEHIMLIDLERNDLGRVCEPGSVEVDELLNMETYAHVHHIVSNVRGRLRKNATPVDAIRAVFPGGTITGCPKVHCMEIIAELEAGGRGPYTGAMGYLGRNGRLDLNILIRTLEICGKQLRFRTGAGIVADSDALAELDETRAKARGLLNALGLT